MASSSSCCSSRPPTKVHFLLPLPSRRKKQHRRLGLLFVGIIGITILVTYPLWVPILINEFVWKRNIRRNGYYQRMDIPDQCMLPIESKIMTHQRRNSFFNILNRKKKKEDEEEESLRLSSSSSNTNIDYDKVLNGIWYVFAHNDPTLPRKCNCNRLQFSTMMSSSGLTGSHSSRSSSSNANNGTTTSIEERFIAERLDLQCDINRHDDIDPRVKSSPLPITIQYEGKLSTTTTMKTTKSASANNNSTTMYTSSSSDYSIGAPKLGIPSYSIPKNIVWISKDMKAMIRYTCISNNKYPDDRGFLTSSSSSSDGGSVTTPVFQTIQILTRDKPISLLPEEEFPEISPVEVDSSDKKTTKKRRKTAHTTHGGTRSQRKAMAALLKQAHSLIDFDEKYMEFPNHNECEMLPKAF